MDNLTDSQRNLLAAVRREMVEVTQPVLDEIARLRQEQTERHERGLLETINEYEIKIKRQERFMVRIANSILALFGKEKDGK